MTAAQAQRRTEALGSSGTAGQPSAAAHRSEGRMPRLLLLLVLLLCFSLLVPSAFACPAGYGGAACVTACSAGRYSPAGASACAACQQGRFSNSPAAANCSACPAGFFAAARGSSTCQACAIGRFSTHGARSCDPCPPSTMNLVVGSAFCLPCMPGYILAGNGSTCAPCSNGFYATTGSTGDVCISAPAGSYTPPDSASIAAVPCAAGRYQPSGGQSACLACPPGSAQSQMAATSCEVCDVGRYANQSDSVLCARCPDGHVAGTNATICSQCASGSYARSGDEECSSCTIGTAQPQPGRSSCQACIAGRYQNATGASNCIPCAVGSFQPSPNSQECWTCPINSKADQRGSIACAACAAGTVAAAGSSACELCAPGRYGELTSGACVRCAPGTYQPLAGQPSCAICAAGNYSSDGAAHCSVCPPGTAAATSQSSSCTPCTAGTMQRAAGATACDMCEPGTFQSNVGQSACLPCPLGTYAPSASMQFCVECPSEVSVDRRNCSWNVCPRNHVYTQTSGCVLCTLGSSAPAGVGTSCSPCLPNAYTPSQGLDCVKCTRSGMEGLLCSNGLASVMFGYYAYEVTVSDESVSPEPYAEFRTAPCPPQMCEGGPLQDASRNQSVAESASVVAAQCAFPRTLSPLCGECAPGYRSWGSECVVCDHANGGMIFAIILVSYVLVVIFLMSDPSSVGFLEILLYFVQTAMLMVGPLASWLNWLRFVNLSTASINTCLGPLSQFGQIAISVLVPFILLVELATLALMHRLCLPLIEKAAHSDRVPALLRVAFQAMWQVDRNKYIACALMVLCFSYTQVSSSSIAYLTCVDVGDANVVFSTPSIHCDTAEYARYRVLVIFMLVVLIAGLPLVSIVGLWLNRDLIREAVKYSLKKRAWVEVQVAESEQRAPRKSIVDMAVEEKQQKQSVHATQTSVDASSNPTQTQDPSAACQDADPTVSSASLSSSPSLPKPPSVPSIPFYDVVLARFGALFSSYHRSAWWWSSMSLIRRALFTAVDIGLVLYPEAKYMSFTIINLATLLVHTLIRPYLTRALNSAETASQVTLTLISALLTAFPPPYSVGVQATLCLLVLPLTLLLILLFMREVRPVVLRAARRLWAQVQEMRARARTREQSADSWDPKEFATVMGRVRSGAQLEEAVQRFRSRTRTRMHEGGDLVL